MAIHDGSQGVATARQRSGCREDLLTIKELIEAGKVRPVIERTYPFGEIREAIAYLETGQARGKVVVTM